MKAKTKSGASSCASQSENELAEEKVAAIRSALLDWYRRGHRDLPWRRTSDPYAIWVSEIMLQQTRVDTVKERFGQFMARFPTVSALAAAPLEEVLALWSGLGYYARARNLHAAAREVASHYAGRIPDDFEAVHSLPGIGPYTAGAILSIAFGRATPILDGNVIRVLARLFALEQAPEGAARRRYWELSAALLPPAPEAPPKSAENDTGDFNQALMELGATVCTPQRPVCFLCPLADVCKARRAGEPERYPPRKAVRPVPVVRVLTLLFRCQSGEVLLARRPAAGLWGGLWEPPTLPMEADESEPAGLRRLLGEVLGLPLSREDLTQLAERHTRALPPFVHILTHREMRFSPYELVWSEGAPPVLKLSRYEAARFIDPAAPLGLGLASWVSTLLGRAAAAADAHPLYKGVLDHAE